MSTERDELAKELRKNFIFPHRVDKDIAEELLAAGYRKPQQVTSVEELDALPAGSLLLSQSEYPRYAGTVWRVSSQSMIEKVGHEVEGVTPARYFKDPLPATVLHVGGAE